MTVEEALILLESVYVEKDIKALNPKDRLAFWAGLKEFVKPKIQRATHELNAGELEAIIIEYPKPLNES